MQKASMKRASSVYLWNLQVRNAVDGGFFLEALGIYSSMLQCGIHANDFTFPLLLKACASLCFIRHGSLLHSHLFQLGFHHHVFVMTSLLHMYSKCSHFRSSFKKSVFSWTTLIGGYVNVGNLREALNLFNQMRFGITPHFIVFVNLISGCGQLVNLLLASSLHALVITYGYDSKDPIDNLLVTMYAKCGDINSAPRVIDMVPEKSIHKWTSMITGYTRLGYPRQALQFFNALLGAAIKPHEATLATVLSACADLGSLSMGEEIEEYIWANRLESNLLVQTSLIHMFCRCGNIEKAKDVFERLTTKDLAAWSSMINDYAIHIHALAIHGS